MMMPNNESGDGHQQSSRQNCKSVPDAITAGEVYDDDGGDDLSLDAQEAKSNLSKRGNGLQPKPSRKGGWGTDSSRKSKRNESEADFEDDRLRPKTQPEEDGGAESDPDVPFIPELEAESAGKGGRVQGGQVAMAPHVAINRVATYKELDYELAKHSTFLTLDNEIDLKLLAKGLCSEAEVMAESDVTWEWDQLFAEVTSDLLTEWESQEQVLEKTGA